MRLESAERLLLLYSTGQQARSNPAINVNRVPFFLGGGELRKSPSESKLSGGCYIEPHNIGNNLSPGEIITFHIPVSITFQTGVIFSARVGNM